jgi:hypothetical protein
MTMQYPNQNYYGNYYGAVPDMLNQYKFQQPQPMINQQPPIMSPTQPTSDFIWVQGEAGAKAYLVAPNSTVTLWDSENATIYLKSADSSGVPSMRILDFTERTPIARETHAERTAGHVCKCGDKFISKEELTALQAKISELEDKIKTLTETKGNDE